MDRPQVLHTLTARILELRRPHPVRVAIDGIDAAGKTVLADDLADALCASGRTVIRASVDGFHNASSTRYARGTDSPEGYFLDSFDYAALRTFLLDPLGPRGARWYRDAVFDYRADRPVDGVPRLAPADSILLFDGVFLLRPELRDVWDISIFLRVSFGTSLQRAMQRDAAQGRSSEDVRRRYAARYIPGQTLYLERCCPERHATILVDNEDPERPRILRGGASDNSG
jgi:uridine kinase